FLYQEIGGTFAGSMEELVAVYGSGPDKGPQTLRVASVDIGGGTSDVMIAEYEDKLPGTGTSLSIKKLFQDGVSIAGDEVCRAIERVLREPLRRYADILAQFDVDLLVLAGRTAALPCIKRLFTSEMPVSPPRVRSMARYRVGEWYPSKWKDQGYIRDPKSTVT